MRDNKLDFKVSNSSDLISDPPSLVSTREESDSFLDSIHKDSSSSSENYDISSSTSYSFASKGDLTSCSSSEKINFDPPILENLSSSFIRDSKFETHSASKSFKIDFDVETFEKHILSERSHIQDDFSESSYS